MRKILLAALAATVALPAAVHAQSANEVRKDQREVQKDRREVRKDIARGNFKEANKDARELRGDQRELRGDWQDYRRTHGDIFRRGEYHGPRGYTYRGLTVGYRLTPEYYGRSYWVDDFARYRLPPPGPGLRWIRYGNDIVLVNMRTGRVVRVINRFFW